MGFVAAVIAFCITASPQTCERHEVRIEKRACGVSFKAEVPINGQWEPAQASVTCSK